MLRTFRVFLAENIDIAAISELLDKERYSIHEIDVATFLIIPKELEKFIEVEEASSKVDM